MIILLRLDGSRALLFPSLDEKETGRLLNYLGKAFLVTEDESGFVAAPATSPNRSLDQDAAKIVECISHGDPRLVPFLNWADEGRARIVEIRRKQAPADPLGMLIGRLGQHAQESVE